MTLALELDHLDFEVQKCNIWAYMTQKFYFIVVLYQLDNLHIKFGNQGR